MAGQWSMYLDGGDPDNESGHPSLWLIPSLLNVPWRQNSGGAHRRKELGKTQGQSEIPRPVTEVTCSTQVKFDLHLKRREWALKNCVCFLKITWNASCIVQPFLLMCDRRKWFLLELLLFLPFINQPFSQEHLLPCKRQLALAHHVAQAGLQPTTQSGLALNSNLLLPPKPRDDRGVPPHPSIAPVPVLHQEYTLPTEDCGFFALTVWTLFSWEFRESLAF